MRAKQMELFAPPKFQQLTLIPYVNPLRVRMGEAFFREIPARTGVYVMRDLEGRVLYVGKAKSLRNRVRSYASAHPERSARKLLKLVQRVESIACEEQPDEKSALLRENQLIRELKPEFNVLNASPHTYLFAHLKWNERSWGFHLSMSHDESYPEVYGAFKGVGLTYRAARAVLRLVWLCDVDPTGSLPPTWLLKPRRLAHIRLPWPSDERAARRRFVQLRRFYNGTSQALLHFLAQELAQREWEPFARSLINQDLETAEDFYIQVARRNRRLKRARKHEGRLIEQAQLDDYLVLHSGL